MDNLKVVKVLNDPKMDDLRIMVFRRVQRLIKLEGIWQIYYVARDENSDANLLSKLSLSWMSSL